LIHENKWRSAQKGTASKLIDFGHEKEVPFQDLVSEMLEFIDDVIDDLGTRKYIDNILAISNKGSSADKQLEVYKQTGKMTDVVDFLIDETTKYCI